MLSQNEVSECVEVMRRIVSNSCLRELSSEIELGSYSDIRRYERHDIRSIKHRQWYRVEYGKLFLTPEGLQEVTGYHEYYDNGLELLPMDEAEKRYGVWPTLFETVCARYSLSKEALAEVESRLKPIVH